MAQLDHVPLFLRYQPSNKSGGKGGELFIREYPCLACDLPRMAGLVETFLFFRLLPSFLPSWPRIPPANPHFLSKTSFWSSNRRQVLAILFHTPTSGWRLLVSRDYLAADWTASQPAHGNGICSAIGSSWFLSRSPVPVFRPYMYQTGDLSARKPRFEGHFHFVLPLASCLSLSKRRGNHTWWLPLVAVGADRYRYLLKLGLMTSSSAPDEGQTLHTYRTHTEQTTTVQYDRPLVANRNRAGRCQLGFIFETGVDLIRLGNSELAREHGGYISTSRWCPYSLSLLGTPWKGRSCIPPLWDLIGVSRPTSQILVTTSHHFCPG